MEPIVRVGLGLARRDGSREEQCIRWDSGQGTRAA